MNGGDDNTTTMPALSDNGIAATATATASAATATAAAAASDNNDSVILNAHVVSLRLMFSAWMSHFRSLGYLKESTMDMLDRGVCRLSVERSVGDVRVRWVDFLFYLFFVFWLWILCLGMLLALFGMLLTLQTEKQ